MVDEYPPKASKSIYAAAVEEEPAASVSLQPEIEAVNPVPKVLVGQLPQTIAKLEFQPENVFPVTPAEHKFIQPVINDGLKTSTVILPIKSPAAGI